MKNGSRKFFRRSLALILAVVSVLAMSAIVPALANDTTIEIGARRNAVPIAENLEFTTFRGVSFYGGFKAVDPDGDPVSFEVTVLPKKGTVSPDGVGGFTYVPQEGAKGKDTFTYVAVDTNGGVSSGAGVTVNIKKQSSKLTYADMEGQRAQYAALQLGESGILIGEQLGDQYFFRPDATVSRGEFLAMCMSVAGTKTLDGVTKTGFFDDSDIPQWVKPYVSAALMNGVVGGYRDEQGRPVFMSNAPVTFPEAAVMLNKVLGITDVTGETASAVFAQDGGETAVPAWAMTAAVNLASCNILQGLPGRASQSVTRADAADMLVRAMAVMDARGGESGGLLSWLT